jgi:hypothetical protein
LNAFSGLLLLSKVTELTYRVPSDGCDAEFTLMAAPVIQIQFSVSFHLSTQQLLVRLTRLLVHHFAVEKQDDWILAHQFSSFRAYPDNSALTSTLIDTFSSVVFSGGGFDLVTVPSTQLFSRSSRLMVKAAKIILIPQLFDGQIGALEELSDVPDYSPRTWTAFFLTRTKDTFIIVSITRRRKHCFPKNISFVCSRHNPFTTSSNNRRAVRCQGLIRNIWGKQKVSQDRLR